MTDAPGTVRAWPGRRDFPLSVAFATGLYSGYLRPAPGTWGSAAACLPAALLLTAETGLSPLEKVVALGIAALIITLVSIPVLNRLEAAGGPHDASDVVIDEFAGQWIALMPVMAYTNTVWPVIAGFLLFRLLDIVKPGPIGWLDRHVGGGFGVMADDVVAGIGAALLLWAGSFL